MCTSSWLAADSLRAKCLRSVSRVPGQQRKENMAPCTTIHELRYNKLLVCQNLQKPGRPGSVACQNNSIIQNQVNLKIEVGNKWMNPLGRYG